MEETLWQEACACPGASAERDRLAAARQARTDRRALEREAILEARPSVGASEAAIRANLVRALEVRGLTWTPARIDATVDMLAATIGQPAQLGALRVAAAAVRGFWRMRGESRHG